MCEVPAEPPKDPEPEPKHYVMQCETGVFTDTRVPTPEPPVNGCVQ